MAHLANTAAAAKYLGISPQAFNKARREGAVPDKGPRGWDAKDLDAWKASRLKIPAAEAASMPGAEETIVAKRRKIAADAARAESEAELAAVKLTRIRGEIVMRVSVDQLLRTIASRQKQVLLSLKAEFLPKLRQLNHSQWEVEADDFIDRICTQMQKLVRDWKPETEDEA
jgi:hypothetical protein